MCNGELFMVGYKNTESSALVHPLTHTHTHTHTHTAENTHAQINNKSHGSKREEEALSEAFIVHWEGKYKIWTFVFHSHIQIHLFHLRLYTCWWFIKAAHHRGLDHLLERRKEERQQTSEKPSDSQIQRASLSTNVVMNKDARSFPLAFLRFCLSCSKTSKLDAASF